MVFCAVPWPGRPERGPPPWPSCGHGVPQWGAQLQLFLVGEKWLVGFLALWWCSPVGWLGPRGPSAAGRRGQPLAGVEAAAAGLCLQGREGRGGHQVGRAGCLGRGSWPSAGPTQQACRRRLELLPCRASREAEEREKELREEEKKREGAK